ncbi:MAG: hypothetical protein WCI57_00915 [Candidatus Berkelbacteria bacterium]
MAFKKMMEEKKELLEKDDGSDDASLRLRLVSMYLRHPRKLTNGRRTPLDLNFANKDHRDIYMYGIKQKIEKIKEDTPASLHSIIDEHHERYASMIESMANSQN